MEYNELINGFAEKFAIADLKIDNDATALSIDGIRVEIVHDTVLNEVIAIAEIGAPPPDANGPFAELDAKEKNKVYIVTSLLSQETGKAAFDGQFMAFDRDNFFQPIVTGSDQDADEREFKLSFNQDGKLVLDFEATQNLQVIIIGKSEGKTTTLVTPAGSTAKSNVEFKISADEFERLADLDFTKFNDDATYTHMAQKTGKDKLKGIPETFAKEFRLDTDAVYTDSAIKFDIKDE